MKWAEMNEIQRNATIAEHVMGWQWIPFDYYDASMNNQLWLLPDGQSVERLTPGEWTWYLDEPEVYPEGSPFPLPHKDNRHLPTWIPHYTTSMDAAWQVVEKMVNRMDKPEEEFEWYGPIRHKGNYGRGLFKSHSFDYTKNGGFNSLPCWYVRYAQDMRYAWILADTPHESICLAALRAVGVEIE